MYYLTSTSSSIDLSVQVCSYGIIKRELNLYGRIFVMFMVYGSHHIQSQFKHLKTIRISS